MIQHDRCGISAAGVTEFAVFAFRFSIFARFYLSFRNALPVCQPGRGGLWK
jgi:hypothetical protein